MPADHLEELNRDLLMQKLKSAKRIIEASMSMKELNQLNSIAELWRGIEEFISILRAEKYEAGKVRDLTTYFLSDTHADHIEHIQRDVIMTVVLQDYLQMDDTIERLITSIEWRINCFDDYWDQMKNGIIKNPYLDK